MHKSYSGGLNIISIIKVDLWRTAEAFYMVQDSSTHESKSIQETWQFNSKDNKYKSCLAYFE